MQLTGRTRVAGAPVNYGIYQPTGAPVGPDDLLAALADDGYTGVDSGPIGYLGTGEALARRLDTTGIALAGGWVDLRFADPAGFADDLAQLDAALDVFTAAPVDDHRFAPRPTLACPGNPARMARPGAPTDLASALPAAAWPDFAARVQQAADRCRDRGLEPVFHYHLGTDVETEAEADRLLELTDIAVCLDTGHLALAGGDPVAAVRRWAGRIGQVHLKDADLAAHARVRAAGGGLMDVVAAGGFCALGRGDVDLAGVLAGLDATGYTGWLVIEQDAPADGRDLDRIRADQHANLRWLEEALR
ncbi:sugar phosphate isomerase/epimerase [Micromonospora sp. C28SCA-DRY-2]|uniref:sugar phosphate isomerase/epimerase family protein n=1 Tax=Micromonospora sp. C28SCA-DRY-2 TaxID=3059522 RepID=UPI0026772FC2|nr:sugar phosphate isomerase/epimerase [Micromonospora sp. C28SCA-DRY-2]MDO3705102.1 sugar phosphate isomerase/epimerase [Micromonospora sp. C28SCA-DRY-2]